MRKVFFIGISFLIYACGTSDGFKGAKAVKHSTSELNVENTEPRAVVRKTKPVKKEAQKKRRKRVGDCFIDLMGGPKAKFFISAPKGQYMMKILCPDGVNTHVSLMRCKVIEELGSIERKIYVADNCIGTIGYKEGEFLLRNNDLQGLVVKNNKQGKIVTYTFSNTYNDEHKEEQKKLEKNIILINLRY